MCVRARKLLAPVSFTPPPFLHISTNPRPLAFFSVSPPCIREKRLWSVLPSLLPTHCNTLQLTATHCNIRQHTATHCNTWQPRDKTLVDVALTFGNTHQRTATHYYTLQRTALQYTATPGSREKRLLSMLPSLSPCLSTNMRLGLFCLPKHTRPQTTVGYLECMCHCP